jgi:ArsR family transcriptional regulator
MLETSGLFRLLGDDVRLRLLRLVRTEQLNVSELTAILGIAQSGVSRHLGLLREAGLVRERREAGFTYYCSAADDSETEPTSVWPMLQARLGAESPAAAEMFSADDARLKEVKRQRREQRDTHGTAVDGNGRQLVPGRSWAAWSRALGLLLTGLRVADLGCGDGHLTLEMAAWARSTVGIDRSADLLKHARALARRRGVTNVQWKRGSIERIPLGDGAVDLAVLSQVLHHASDPVKALTEARRIVSPGGRVLVLELDQHDQEWVTGRFGDRWLGFDRSTLTTMMDKAGFDSVRVETGLDDTPFGVVMAVGTRAAAQRASARQPAVRRAQKRTA